MELSENVSTAVVWQEKRRIVAPENDLILVGVGPGRSEAFLLRDANKVAPRRYSVSGRLGTRAARLKREYDIDHKALRAVDNFGLGVTVPGGIFPVLEGPNPFELGMGILHRPQFRGYIQHQRVHVTLLLRPRELGALNPIIADGFAFD